MTPREQKDFIRQLSETIAADICNQIDDQKIPDDWDGRELRQLLAYRHNQSAHMGRNARITRRVNNTILVNNL